MSLKQVTGFVENKPGVLALRAADNTAAQTVFIQASFHRITDADVCKL